MLFRPHLPPYIFYFKHQGNRKPTNKNQTKPKNTYTHIKKKKKGKKNHNEIMRYEVNFMLFTFLFVFPMFVLHLVYRQMFHSFTVPSAKHFLDSYY